MPAAMRMSTTPRPSGSPSCRAIHPWRARTTTSSTPMPIRQIRWTRPTHPRTSRVCPVVWSMVIRRTTPTRTAEPGMDRMKNSPSSWAISPYEREVTSRATATTTRAAATFTTMPAMAAVP